MKSLRLGILSIFLLLGLTACGTTNTERALSGAGVGAAIGAGAAALTEADLLTGAAIGAAVGAATGALTEEETINLNDLSIGED